MFAEDQIRFVLALIISVPFCFILQKLQSPKIRHIYSTLLGTVLQIFVYGYDIWMVFLLNCAVYLTIKMTPHKCGKLITVSTLVGLSVFHIYRMIINYGSWSVDLSTVIMTIICKYSLFAYAVEDGHNKKKSLTPEQEQNKIQKMPSFLHFISYCQFLPTAIMGTSLQYTHFSNYMNKVSPFDNIPSPWKDVFFDMGYGIFLAGFFVIHVLFFSLKEMQSQQFPNQGFIYIMMFSFFSVTTLKMKYYFAWKFSQGAVHASGVSYRLLPKKNEGDSENQIGDFKGIQTCNPEVIETTKHIRVKISNWNMSCQEWLRKSIYERTQIKGRSSKQLLTFMVSSFWHGFYGGYYISFFFWFSQLYLSQLIFSETKKQTSKYVKTYKKTGIVGRAFLWIASNYLFTVNGIYFQVLQFGQSLRILLAIYFIPPLLVILPIILLTLYGTREKRIKPVQKSRETISSSDEVYKKIK